MRLKKKKIDSLSIQSEINLNFGN